MGKNPRKPAAPRKTKHTLLPLSSPILVDLAKQKLIQKSCPRPLLRLTSHHLRQLVNEEILECPICLQLMLSPILAQCGHSFCLPCAQDLATHKYACGICHTHDPTYDLPGSKMIQTLLDQYLMRSQEEEQGLYEKRKQILGIKEVNRRIRDPQVGDFVDYWCDGDLVWKNGTISEIMKTGVLTIANKKGTDEVILHASSRKLAPQHHFTKEERPSNMPDVRMQPMQLVQGRNFDTLQMAAAVGDDRPRIFGMPLFLGYYWGRNDMNNMNSMNNMNNGERGAQFDGADPFNF